MARLQLSVLLIVSCLVSLTGPFYGNAHVLTPPPTPPSPSLGPAVASVSTGEQLQQALRDHARHIIVNDHLDLTALPLFSANTITSTAVGVVAWGTDSIRVRFRPLMLQLGPLP